MPKKAKKIIKKVKGLSSTEAGLRLKKYGENSITSKEKIRPITAFLKKLNSPLLLIVIATAIASFLLGEHINGVILICMVALSTVLDFVNTYKSEKAVEKLVAKVAIMVTVIRDGKRKEVPIVQVVPGDLVYLAAGDIIPADCQVIESDDFFVNQSVLTGEPFPIEKKASRKDITNDKFDTNNNSLVLMGTSAATGFATVLVLRTGRQTEFGKIADQLVKGEGETDFDKSMKRFSLFIMRVATFMVGFVFLINALLGHGWLQSFLFSLAIVIGVTPELLPVIISISLSRGAIQMTKKDVIVKNLSSIQNFGSMDVLCTDKTGTLTKNQIVLARHINSVGNNSDKVLLYAYLSSVFHTGIENPLDSAIKSHERLDIERFKKVDEIPFDFHRKRQSIVVDCGVGRLLITKGAPEEVIKVCNRYESANQELRLTLSTKKKIEEKFNNLSKEGFRVLAIASTYVEGGKKQYPKESEEKMLFMGFLAFDDPAKETAAQSVAEIEKLGIEVKILTGDNDLLTEKICRDINLPIKGVVTGEHLHSLNDLQLRNLALKTTIFARITPEQKERIVTALRNAGKVVGYLGDGINDAPSLKSADIGISVNNAVDVAKETADIILLQKSLHVIKDGVIEGRKTFENTMKYILMGFSSNFGNMFSMMGASAFLPFLPMTPSQIILNNFIYDSSQATLATDAVDKEDTLMPVKWNAKFLLRYMIIFGLASSIFDFLTYGILFIGFHASQAQFQTGWFIESIATQVFVIYIIRTRKIPFIQSRPSRALFFNTFLAVVLAWVLPYTIIGKFLGFSSLSLTILVSLALLVIIYLLLVEFVKRWFYHRWSSLER